MPIHFYKTGSIAGFAHWPVLEKSVEAKMSNKSKLSERQFQPRYLVWILFLHTFCLIGLFYSTHYELLILSYGLAMLTAYSMGIFHHMYLSHKSFEASPWLKNLGVLFGTLTWRGPMAAPIRYAAMHRIHHRYSDKASDPHSPEHGILHALIGWNWFHSDVFQEKDAYFKLAPSWVRKDKFIVFCNNNVNLLQFGFAALLFLLGYAIKGITLGLELVLYGVGIKTLIVVYAANLVDLINHTVGYRNFETGEHSTNSMIMGVVHLGGAISWHNNHHARPKYFSVKKQWWEFDAHRLMIQFFQLFGAVRNIQVLDESKSSQVSGQETRYGSV